MILKPHTVTLYTPSQHVNTEGVAGGIDLDGGQQVRGQLTPERVGEVFEKIGIQLKSPMMWMWDDFGVDFPTGAHVKDSDGKLYIVSSDTENWKFGRREDSRVVYLDAVQLDA